MVENGRTQTILGLLEHGQIEMTGLVPWGSNYTFLVQVCHEKEHVDAIYKPSKGERPLWDFAEGSLNLRERAAFLVSETLQWRLVPPTILRDGPHGTGSVQYYVEHDTQQHYLTLEGEFEEQIRRIVVFDILINNADRKSGHVLLGQNDRLWAIDHGVSFHSDYKLRTVIWEYAGEPIADPILSDLTALRTWLASSDDVYRSELLSILSASEQAALCSRIDKLIELRHFPMPGPGRHYPWPVI